eukprot:TRINITY_DN29079_c0_g1_i1.p1 TRINITY_DN29079_c0_g1~~TRINITY_DN29079_c0_g1_i1.p1  ORF type:complete len:908 (+),score=192.24 TRINITY_DN29079_c0_g1_i1:142-2865(+)
MAIPQFQETASVVWNEVKGEVITVGLFCIGFLIYHLAVRGKQSFSRGSKKYQQTAPEQTAPVRARRRGLPSAEARPQKRSVESSAFHAHAQRVRSALDKSNVQDAMSAITLMHESGHAVPGSLLVSLLCLSKEIARSSGPSLETDVEVLQRLPRGALCAENFIGLAQHAANSGDATLVRQVHLLAKGAGLVLSTPACDALLRGYAASSDPDAADMFDELLVQADGSIWRPSEGMLATAIGLCAEPRSIRLAERMMAYAHEHGTAALPIFASLLKVYTFAKLWDKACGVYDDMRQTGVKPDVATYGALIKAAVECGRPEMAAQLFQESRNPDTLNIMSMIRSAGREKDVEKALQLLEEMERSPLQPDAAQAYNCALEACIAAGDTAAAEKLFKRMEDVGQVDVVSYNTYIKVLLQKGHKEVERVLATMRARGIKPNVVTYNSMVKDATARQDLKRAWALTDEMERAGVSPDAFTCSILMAGIKHSFSGQGVDRILALMQRSNVTPDGVLLNCILDVCIRLRDPRRLGQVLDQWQACGGAASQHASALLIRAYGHAMRLEKALELWRQVREDKVTEEAFVNVIDACLANSDVRATLKIFREVREQLSEFPRAQVAFSLTVKAALQLKMLPMALELYQEIKGVVSIGTVTYNTFLDALEREGDLKQAMELFKDMVLANVSPDVITYSILIKGYAAARDLETSITLLGQMQRRNIKPDSICFNSVLHGCAHSHKRALAETVLEDMDKAGVQPSNFTLSILVKLYGRCGDLDAALKVTETYPARYGFKLNTQVYTCLMATCISAGDLSKAFEVYRRMVAAGCQADSKTFDTLLNGCLRYQDPKKAADIIADAVGKQPFRGLARLNKDTLESAVVMAHKRGRTDLATKIMDHMKVAGVEPSSRTVACVRGSRS